MAPKYLLQFDTDAIMEERNIDPGPVETKLANRHRYDISKKWRQLSRKLIMHIALIVGSSLNWYWDLTSQQFQASLTED